MLPKGEREPVDIDKEQAQTHLAVPATHQRVCTNAAWSKNNSQGGFVIRDLRSFMLTMAAVSAERACPGEASMQKPRVVHSNPGGRLPSVIFRGWGFGPLC